MRGVLCCQFKMRQWDLCDRVYLISTQNWDLFSYLKSKRYSYISMSMRVTHMHMNIASITINKTKLYYIIRVILIFQYRNDARLNVKTYIVRINVSQCYIKSYYVIIIFKRHRAINKFSTLSNKIIWLLIKQGIYYVLMNKSYVLVKHKCVHIGDGTCHPRSYKYNRLSQ